MLKFFLKALPLLIILISISGCATQQSDSANSGIGEPKKITISIDPNYEKGRSSTVVRNVGDPIFLQDPANSIPQVGRKGFIFSGWFLDKDGANPVEQDYIVKEDLIIYASWEAWDTATTNRMDLCLSEVEKGKYITSRPAAYEEASFNNYFSLVTPLIFLTMGGNVLPAEMEGLDYAAKAARENLVQIMNDPEDACWYIWTNDIAESEDAEEYDYYGTWDNPGFKPFLVPYMLKDQTSIKGNIILISGGGFAQRANRWEAYPSVKAFNDLGYNCFVLQRRVFPSSPIDAGLDLQRSIRYIKANAKKYGIAGTDRIAAAGFSGGGMTITIAVEQFYGNILPSAVYPAYKPVDIDSLNSDLSSMIMVYSAGPLETQNPNIPDAFVVIGNQDFLLDSSLEALNYYTKNNIRYEAHIFSDAAHGFGVGFGLNAINFTDEDIHNIKIWPQLADTFMQIQYGDLENIKTLSN